MARSQSAYGPFSIRRYFGLLMSGLGAAAAWGTTVGQNWYPVLLALTAFPTAWIGAKLWLMQSHSQTAVA